MRIYILIISLISIIAFGCGSDAAKVADMVENDAGGEKIAVSFDGKEHTLAPVYAKFVTFEKNLITNDAAISDKKERIPATVHRIYLANYDLQLTDPAKQDYKRITNADQIRVEIQIEAEKGAGTNAKIKAKEYAAKTEPFDRVSWISVARFVDGGDLGQMIGGKAASGAVKITDVSDAEISGEIDFQDANGSVKGKFTAQRLNK